MNFLHQWYQWYHTMWFELYLMTNGYGDHGRHMHVVALWVQSLDDRGNVSNDLPRK